MHIKSFGESINEGIRDKMTPKPMDDVKKAIEKLSPYKALAKAKKYGLDDLVEICLERTKSINEKLYQDTKEFNKKTLQEFLEFVCTWIDDQGGESYTIQERFNDIVLSMGDFLEEGEEYEDDEGNLVTEDDGVEESIFSDDTVNLFKQFVIKYVIEHMTHSTYVREDEEEGEYDEEEYWGDEEDEEYNIDYYFSDIAVIISDDFGNEGIEIKTEEVESILYSDFEDEVEEAHEVGIDPEHCADTIRFSKKFTEKMEIKKKLKEEQIKKEENKKPINKIKKFLGFDKDDNEVK